MKPNYTAFLLLFFLFFQTVFAQNKQQAISSKIEKVTVFTSGGQVTRKAKVTIPQGKTELVFAGISPNIDKQSIQVKAEGNFTILSVIHQTNYLNEQERRQETTLLENQKEGLKNKLRVENSMILVFKNEEAMLSKNQAIGGDNTGVRTVDLREAVDFQRNRLTEVLLKQVEIQNAIQKLDSTIRKIDQQLRVLNQNQNYATSEVLLTVSAKEAVQTSFEISYFVRNAGWFATYDLRVKDVSSPIDLALKANIFQSSGEDWKDVKLTISNGNPTESGVAPNLQAWYLRFAYEQRPQSTSQATGRVYQDMSGKSNQVSGKVTDEEGGALPGVTILVKGTTMGTATDVDGNYSLKIPENSQILVFNYIGYQSEEVLINSKVINVSLGEDMRMLSEVVITDGKKRKEKERKQESKQSSPLETTEKYQTTTLTFEIEMPYTILNDGKVYVADIKNMSVPALYEYFAVPKIATEAYLTAKIIDWQDLNLLEGEINLFFEGAYLGKSILDVRNANDTLDISLGKDKGIVIERKKLKDFSSKQFLSSYKTENRAYEISVRNNKPQSVKIVVQDQFPISTNKEITVEEQEYKDAQLDKDTKILTWKYEISAKQERKHILKYGVKYPKNQVLSLD